VRRLVAAVAVAGAMLPACSPSTPAPFRTQPPLPGSIVAGDVIAEDLSFPPERSTRARYVPCQGVAACLRTANTYPGTTISADVESGVRFTQFFIIYLVGASFDQATFDGTTVHVRIQPRATGLQIAKLDGSDVLPVADPTFSFQDENGKVLCTSSWEGCG
jgi:hypothetical protein